MRISVGDRVQLFFLIRRDVTKFSSAARHYDHEVSRAPDPCLRNIDLIAPEPYLWHNSFSLSRSPVHQVPPQSVSLLLMRWRSGDQEALQALIPLVYKDL